MSGNPPYFQEQEEFMKGLTSRQLDIVNFIQEFIKLNNYSPSYREIMSHFSFTSLGTVYKHIQRLKNKGLVTADKQSHRSVLPILTESRQEPKEIQLPLIGNLSIGYPLELFVKPQMLAVPPSLVHAPDDTYLLQAQGDSLIDEAILDGDILLIETRQDIQPGEMILGLINQHDTVLKKYYPEGQYIRLESRHPQNRPLTIRHDHIQIQGVLVGLFRVY